MRILILAAVAWALISGLAQAADDEPQITNPTAVVQNITADDIAGILREIGGADISIGEAEGEKVVSFNDRGVPFSIIITVCEKANPAKCYGFGQLMMLEDKGYSYTALNQLNIDTVTLTLFKNEKESYVGFARVELVDGGVTRQRIASAITWYVVEVHEALTRLTQQVVAGVNAGGKTNTLTMAGADAVRPVALKPEIAARIAKAAGRPADENRLKKLNAK